MVAFKKKSPPKTYSDMYTVIQKKKYILLREYWGLHERDTIQISDSQTGSISIDLCVYDILQLRIKRDYHSQISHLDNECLLLWIEKMGQAISSRGESIS
jgi:hypothetical protein